MPNRPKAYTRHQSRLDPITAVIKYYALIGVNEKLSNLPPNHRPAYTAEIYQILIRYNLIGQSYEFNLI